MSWEFDYAPGDRVERRLMKSGKAVWRRGRVNDDWTPRPGFGVAGTYDDTGGPFRATGPEQLRHR